MVSKTYVDLTESHRTLPADVQRLADVPQDEKIEVSVYLKPRAQPGAADQTEPLTDHRAAMQTQRLAEHQDDIHLLTEFAAENGLTVSSVEPVRRLVKLTGPASKMQAAFGTTLAVYHDGKQQFRGRSGSLRLPEDVHAVVQAVLGLDNRPAVEPHFVKLDQVLSPNVIGGHRPNAVGAVYGFPTGYTGTGQCIGIVELGGGYLASDNTAAFAAMGLATPTVVAVSVDGGHNSPGASADGEVALDIQVAGGVAPGSRIAVYFAPNTFQGFVDCVSSAAHDTVNKPSIISISWGTAELNWTTQAAQAMNTALQDAAQLNVSVFAASGDHLGTDGVADGKAHVDHPASSPWAIGCGGTTLDVTGTTVNSEVVWNDGASGWGTGGGISKLYPMPAFQQGANVPVGVDNGLPGRGVPDVAGDASQASGYLIVLNGATTQIGGTSAVAPLWAGLTALLNQASGKSLGFFMPTLYQNPHIVRAITTGNNKPVNSSLGYTAANGWSACTGLGVPIGSALLSAFTHVVTGPVGVTTVNQRPYAFVQNNTGHLWVNWWDGSAWHWSDQGVPTGGTVAGPVGVTTVNQRPYAFVQSNTGHLWVNWWDGSAWHWSDQGVPTGGTVTGPVGVTIVNQRPYAFVRSNTGHLWVNWWDGSAWHWSDQGVPTGGTVAGAVGVTTVNQRPYAFVRSNTGHLWVNWWDGSAWHWSDQGVPTGGTVAGPVGVTTVNQRPYAFVQSSGGHLWVNWWDGAAWHWSDQGVPTGGTVVGPVGVDTVNQRPYAFVESSAGQLWVDWWDGSAWHWSAQ